MPRGPRRTRLTRSNCKCWCITLNNYSEEEWTKIVTMCDAQPPTIRFMILARERGSVGNLPSGSDGVSGAGLQGGTPHLQGYIQYLGRVRRTRLKSDCGPRGHYEAAKGSAEDNITYCRKEIGQPWSEIYTWGIPQSQGQRSDWDKLRKRMKEGKSYNSLVVDHPEFISKCVMYPNGIIRAIGAFIMPRGDEDKTGATWLYGQSGAGKSIDARCIAKNYKSVYYKSDSTSWWPNYNGEECVIWNDIRLPWKGPLKCNELLNLLDAGPHQIQHKGGYTQFRAKHVIFTSPWPPDQVFQTAYPGENHRQLLRRINNIVNYIGVWPTATKIIM